MISVWDKFKVMVASKLNWFVKKRVKPQEVIEYAIDNYERSFVQTKMQVAEMIAAKKNLQRKTQELRNRQPVNETLIKSMEVQTEKLTERIGALKHQLGNMENNIMELNARKEDLIIRANLLQTQESIQKLLGSLNETNINKLIDNFDTEITKREDVIDAMAELDNPNAGVKYLTE